MKNTGRYRVFLQNLYTAWANYNPARLAAALAYYSMFSLAPMIYVALTMAGLFVNTLEMANQLFGRMANTIGADATKVIQDMVINISTQTTGGTPLSTLISLGALLYAATGLFAHLKYSLNTIWDVPLAKQSSIIHFVQTRLLAFVLVMGVALVLVLAVFLSLVLSALTSFFNFSGYVLTSNIAMFILLLTLSFAILYRILPDAEVRWRHVWPGAVITALVFAIGRWGLGLYFSYSSVGTAFEAAGALAIVLIAVYYGAQIFLFGAMFTRVYATTFEQTEQAAAERVEE